jgi:hypothetical protein
MSKVFMIKSKAVFLDTKDVKNIYPLIVVIDKELSKITALYRFYILLISVLGIYMKVLPKKIFFELKLE